MSIPHESSRLKSPVEAWDLLQGALGRPVLETASRAQAAWRVLARDLVARSDVPSFDVSAMDGYALPGPSRAGEQLEVDQEIAAGDPPGSVLEPTRAARIMTGAPVPEGADRVVPVELTDGGAERVTLRQEVESGANIRRRGEIVAQGDPLLPAGELLTPSGLSLLATHGIDDVPVYRRPTVAVLATGDEVVPASSEPGPGQLRDSHSDFFAGALPALGISPKLLGIAGDDPQVLRSKVEEGLASDVLLVTGGVSMGEFDFVEGVLEGLGCELLFDAVAIQPGKPMVAARHPGGLVFGLPGNPASAMVTYWLFVRPALRCLAGARDGFWRGALNGRLLAELPGAKGRDRFLPAHVRFENGEPLVRPLVPQGSHDTSAYGLGTALVRIPAHSEPAAPDAPCQFLPLVEWPPDGDRS